MISPNHEKPSLKGSLVFRVTLRVALLVTVVTAIVLAVGGWLLQRQAIRSLEVTQIIEATELAEIITNMTDASSAQIKHRIENEADSDFALFFIQIVTERGEVVFKSPNLGDGFLPTASPHSKSWTTTVTGAGEVRVVQVPAGVVSVQVASPIEPVTQIMHGYIHMSLALILATALLSLLVGYAFSRVTVAPVRAIEATASRIRADNLSERIAVPGGNDELAALAKLLNRTFDHLETSFTQVRRFSADVSHELKTPLALIRLSGEKLRTQLQNKPEAEALVADMLEETERMRHIIESLLFIAKVEGGALMIQRESVEMSKFVTEFTEDARALAEDRDVIFKVGKNENGHASIAPQSLRQLLFNLTSNALAASPKGGVITLDSESTSHGWRLTLTDEGAGLPPEILERIFERFARHQPTSSPDGHGLGLAICRSIAGLHGGVIRAENRADRSGLLMIFEW